MKKKYLILIILVSLLYGCTYEDFDPSEWAVEPQLELSESGLVFNAAKNTDTVKIVTNYMSYEVTCEDTWCTIRPNYSNSTIVVEVDPNMMAEQRRTTINVKIERGTKEMTKKLSVVQMGGYWDVIDQFSVYWSSDVTETQKETISEILSNMVYVRGGTFVMGASEDYTYDDDTRHDVTLSDFYINKTEVTQKQWNVIMGNNNSNFKGDNLPVENIEWEEALEYVYRLSRLTNLNFSIPTEAQWEYSARGGSVSMGYLYSGSDNHEDVMVYKGPENLSDPSYSTYEVAQLLPNELGLYDMSGNVSELCYDWYADYDLSPQIDPVGPAVGEYHVKRGGDISDYYYLVCFVYSRFPFITKDHNYVGLRLCIKP